MMAVPQQGSQLSSPSSLSLRPPLLCLSVSLSVTLYISLHHSLCDLHTEQSAAAQGVQKEKTEPDFNGLKGKSTSPGQAQYYEAPMQYQVGEADDLSKLDHLDEDGLVKQVKVPAAMHTFDYVSVSVTMCQKRYENDKIYTFVSDILIAINPCRSLPIYGPEVMSKYHDKPMHKVPLHHA